MSALFNINSTNQFATVESTNGVNDNGMFASRDRDLGFATESSTYSGLIDDVVVAEIAFRHVPIQNTLFASTDDKDAIRFDIDVDQLRIANAIAMQPDEGYARIAINDTIGPQGSRDFALPFDAVIGFDFGCSGALIAPDVVISARHCGGGAGSGVYFGPEGLNNPTFRATVTEEILPAGPGTLLDGGDVSIHILDRDVPEDIATPMRFVDETDSLVGRRVALIGYGLNGIGSEGHQGTSDGNRWGGTNIIDTYGETPGGGAGTANIISTDFDDGTDINNSIAGSDPDPLEFEATTAGGDSGGPVLVQTPEGEWAIAGVLSGGTNFDSSYGDISWWTGTAIYREQIENAGGEFVGATPDVDDHSNALDLSATEIVFNSTPIARSQGFIGTADEIADVDVFRFEILRNARIIVDAVSVRRFDPYLKVYDSSGALIGENNDKEGSTSSQLLIEVDAGIYYAEVSSNDPEDTGQYRIAARHNGASDDFGGRFSNAEMISLNDEGNTKINGQTETEDDVDMFRFIADRSGDFVVRSTAKSGDLNTVLRVFDGNRTLISGNNNWNGSLDSRLLFNLEAGEQYYVALSSVKITQGSYSLNFIPKTEDEDNGRQNVDLEMAVRQSLTRPLTLEQFNRDTNMNFASPTKTDLDQLTEYGARPLGLIANG